MNLNPELVDRLMDRAARIAFRGHGLVEQGCMVGAVVVDAGGSVLAEGRYRRYGGSHAERSALKQAGDRARGGTLLVTLEPCDHHGKTPPCTEAVITSGVAEVIHACHDPNDLAAGGTKALQDAGIGVTHHPTRLTELLNAPHVHRTRHGLPWVTAKWAQTLDGRIATGSGRSKWISSARSRRMVHRERARVDAIVTGIGTVLADDPMLTPRDVRRVARSPERVVIDDALDTPLTARLVTTAERHPTTIVCAPEAFGESRAEAMRSAGVRVVAMDPSGELKSTFRTEAQRQGWSTVLVESGGGLMGRLLGEHLVNQALIITSSSILGDDAAPGPVRGRAPESIQEAMHLEPVWSLDRNPDRIGLYRVPGGD